jgi:hypothetical protein
MEDLFHQMDKDKSGNITLEEFKYGLKDFGLRLTSVSSCHSTTHSCIAGLHGLFPRFTIQKQLDLLLEELDADRSGTIEFE